MSLAHGKPIEAEEVERVVSREFDARRFASLCNSIAWAHTDQRPSSLPSFTERVNVKDGGVDAEWEAALPEGRGYYGPLLGPGLNISQYKQRDVFAQSRAKIFTDLARGMECALKDLYKSTGNRPDRYMVFINLDLTHEQKSSLIQKIMEGYDRPQDVHVGVVGAAELAAFLNDLPHLRSAFFATNQFSTWETAWQAHTQQKIYGANVELVGRNNELRDVSSAIADPSVRVLTLAGPNNIGKTRLAMEATRSRSTDTIVAVDPRSMAIVDLLAFEHPKQETVVIIEDPDPEDAEAFVHQALAQTNLKLIITFPTGESAPGPQFGSDKRVVVFNIGHLDESDSAKLLEAASAQFDYSMQSWVVGQCGGNPGLLLLAASAGGELRERSGDFLEELGCEFEKKVQRTFGERAIEVLRRLSLLTHVGIRDQAEKEIEFICKALGDDIQVNTVLNELPSLEKAGIIRIRGLYAEVQPPIFANHLATAALRGRYAELLALLVALDNRARMRFLRRLHALRGDEVGRFWDELFGVGAPFENIESALTNAHLLRLVAGARPELVAQVIEDGLKRMNRAERLAIEGTVRRELMWTIEELLFRKKTSESALRCLAMLAEAENENIGNNATGVLCECFIPMHPQFPLPLDARLALLDEILSPVNSIEMRHIGLKAIESALRGHGSVLLRRGTGLEPLGSRPVMTYGEVCDFMEHLVDSLMNLTRSNDPTLAEKAKAKIPFSIAELAIQGRPAKAISLFSEVVEWVLKGEAAIPVAELIDAIRHVQDNVTVRSEKTDQEVIAKFRAFMGQMEDMIRRLENADFSTRLRRWAGNWSRDDHTNVAVEGQKPLYRSEMELTRLAGEAIENPDLLCQELLGWLCSDQAKKAHMFFWSLGSVDSQRSLLPTIEKIAQGDRGAYAFASYCGGLSRHSREFVSERLDVLAQANQIIAESIVGATQNIGVDEAGVKRLLALLEGNRVSSSAVARAVTYSSLAESVDLKALVPLLRAIAGPALEHAGDVIDFLAMRLQAGSHIEGAVAEVAWQCLEACPPMNMNIAYDCDQVAASLTKKDPERGLRLLESLLRQPSERGCWEPLERHRGSEFWKSLEASLGDRALISVLSIGLADPIVRFRLTWSLSDVVDQEAYAELLLRFAMEREKQAELVAEIIDGGRPSFWTIAIGIVENYPGSARIKSALTAGAEHTGHVITGSYATHLEKCRKEVEDVLNDKSTPPGARGWLQELQSFLRTYRDREQASEIDEEVNEYLRMAGNPEAPERLWAIRTLLRQGKLKELLTSLSKTDLIPLLRHLDLSEGEAAEIRRRLETLQD